MNTPTTADQAARERLETARRRAEIMTVDPPDPAMSLLGVANEINTEVTRLHRQLGMSLGGRLHEIANRAAGRSRELTYHRPVDRVRVVFIDHASTPPTIDQRQIPVVNLADTLAVDATEVTEILTAVHEHGGHSFAFSATETRLILNPEPPA